MNKLAAFILSIFLSGCTYTRATKRVDGTFDIRRASLGTTANINFSSDGNAYTLGYNHEQYKAFKEALDRANALLPK